MHHSRLDFKYPHALGILAGYTSAKVVNNYNSRKVNTSSTTNNSHYSLPS